MHRERNSGAEQGLETGKEKKPYRAPRIVSSELLEVVAATCDGGKAEYTGFDACGTSGPIAS